MRAISLWQPWATAIALGAKRIETRSWPTNHRGAVAIHAAKRCRKGELLHFQCCWNWQGALGLPGFGKARLLEMLPFGAIVAVCDLVTCSPIESFTLEEIRTERLPPKGSFDGYEHNYKWTEEQLGDFSSGRFGWVLANVRPLSEPLPYCGSQGFFHVDDDLLNGGNNANQL